jgi:hypothetical protein
MVEQGQLRDKNSIYEILLLPVPRLHIFVPVCV